MSGKWGIPPKLDGGHASAFSVRRFSIHSSHAREDVGRYGVSDIKKLLKATQGDTPQLIDLISTNPHKIGSYPNPTELTNWGASTHVNLGFQWVPHVGLLLGLQNKTWLGSLQHEYTRCNYLKSIHPELKELEDQHIIYQDEDVISKYAIWPTYTQCRKPPWVSCWAYLITSHCRMTTQQGHVFSPQPRGLHSHTRGTREIFQFLSLGEDLMWTKLVIMFIVRSTINLWYL